MTTGNKSAFGAMLSVVLLLGVAACHGNQTQPPQPSLGEPDRSGDPADANNAPASGTTSAYDNGATPSATQPQAPSTQSYASQPAARSSTARMSLHRRRRTRVATIRPTRISKATTRQEAMPRATMTILRISRKSTLPSRRRRCRSTSSPIARGKLHLDSGILVLVSGWILLGAGSVGACALRWCLVDPWILGLRWKSLWLAPWLLGTVHRLLRRHQLWLRIFRQWLSRRLLEPRRVLLQPLHYARECHHGAQHIHSQRHL